MADLASALPLPDNALRPLTATPNLSGTSTRAEAERVAKEFERMFLTEMLQPMFAGVETDGPFGGGAAEAMFRPMLIDQYAAAIADAGGVGIANTVLSELIRLQELAE
jgi:Rod binding domain-containing protein